MAAYFKDMMLEPVDSIHIVELRLLKNTSQSKIVYKVVFDIRVKNGGISMTTGQYEWTYELTWDTVHDSWLITNYGEC